MKKIYVITDADQDMEYWSNLTAFTSEGDAQQAIKAANVLAQDRGNWRYHVVELHDTFLELIV